MSFDSENILWEHKVCLLCWQGPKLSSWQKKTSEAKETIKHISAGKVLSRKTFFNCDLFFWYWIYFLTYFFCCLVLFASSLAKQYRMIGIILWGTFFLGPARPGPDGHKGIPGPPEPFMPKAKLCSTLCTHLYVSDIRTTFQRSTKKQRSQQSEVDILNSSEPRCSHTRWADWNLSRDERKYNKKPYFYENNSIFNEKIMLRNGIL